jgi:hypothetical protein
MPRCTLDLLPHVPGSVTVSMCFVIFCSSQRCFVVLSAIYTTCCRNMVQARNVTGDARIKGPTDARKICIFVLLMKTKIMYGQWHDRGNLLGGKGSISCKYETIRWTT